MTARPALPRPKIGVAGGEQGVGVDEIDDAAFGGEETATFAVEAEPKRVCIDRDNVWGAEFGEPDFSIRVDRNHAVA